MAIACDDSLDGIDWAQAKADLASRDGEWTKSEYRRHGIASGLTRMLAEAVPGQHVGLQADDAHAFYASLGYEPQPEFWSLVAGTSLGNDANR